MAIIDIITKADDAGGTATDVTSTNARDSDYNDTEIRLFLTDESEEPGMDFRFTEVSVFWFHARANLPSEMDDDRSDGTFMRFYDASGDLVADMDMDNGSMAARALGTSTVASTYSKTYLSGSLAQTIDVKVDLSGTDIIIEYYIGEVLTYSATATKNGQSGIARFHLCNEDVANIGTNYQYWSEVILADEDTRGMRVATLSPDGNGGETDWSGDFNDVLDASDGAFIASDTANERETFTLGAYNGPTSPSSIRTVAVKSVVRAGDSGPQNFKHLLRIGTTNYESSQLAGTNERKISFWDDDPSTSSPWNTTALASLEAGLKSET